MSATRVAVVALTPEGFAPFGTIGMPQGDGAHGASDVPLDPSQGRPRVFTCGWQGVNPAT
jgi:ureidoglycolate hydrolase